MHHKDRILHLRLRNVSESVIFVKGLFNSLPLTGMKIKRKDKSNQVISLVISKLILCFIFLLFYFFHCIFFYVF